MTDLPATSATPSLAPTPETAHSDTHAHTDTDTDTDTDTHTHTDTRTHTLLTVDRLVTADIDWAPAWIEIRSGRIAARGEGRPPRDPDEHVPATVVPGFVDIHSHGALGADFGTAATRDIHRIIDFHAARGTTRIVASVATAPLETLHRAIATLRPLVEDGTLAGIHLEGPYLSPARRGAHNPALLRTPDLAEVKRLIAIGGGTVRMLTIAPELPGAEPVIRWLVANGVTVALGHSDADATTTRSAIGWGATVVTHLFNGMKPLHHREPGLAGVALVDDRVTVELILDGHHVSTETAEIVRRTAPGRLALVSDAMSATGLGDGDYDIAGSAVRVTGGVAWLADGSSLAGSTATLADGFRGLLAAGGARPAPAAPPAAPSAGPPSPGSTDLTAAIAASSATPARALGLDPADLTVGSPADLVHLHGTDVARVMRRGAWLTSS
ncbi:N-acetylglucosamine-6-phosphate deacetylase [Glaciihabitans sp. dw_435]|uniref:N-acetylglucosamine-6-phosphate deacetylase n=1 Tax=Glaciihabitans sp. dw_435 TaxID=2720081 RepID=UPI001BD45CED|nr:amidohydrolase family protein [Glaciihabitans sp. dw_435]